MTITAQFPLLKNTSQRFSFEEIIFILLTTVFMSIVGVIALTCLMNFAAFAATGPAFFVMITIIAFPGAQTLLLLVYPLLLLWNRWYRPLVVTLLCALGACHGYFWAWLITEYLYAGVIGPHVIDIHILYPCLAGSLCGVGGAFLALSRLPELRQWPQEERQWGRWFMYLGAFLNGTGVVLELPIILLVLITSGLHGEHMLHQHPSPDGRYTAFVIEGNCGATCTGNTWINVQSKDGYFRSVYDKYGECDLTMQWIDVTTIEVKGLRIDMREVERKQREGEH